MAAVRVVERTGAAPLPAAPATAAGRLYEAYAERILRFCRSRLRSREEAEDAVQLTYLHALRALRRGVVPQCEVAWLLKIAENVCRSTREAAGRRSVEEPREPHVLAERVAAGDRPADELFALSEALATLTDRQRHVILLREWRGLSYQEIADELGISRAAVETALFRARGALAAALERGSEAGRRERGGVLDLGTLVAAAKQAFAGATGAKVAAGVLAVAVLVPVPPPPRQPARDSAGADVTLAAGPAPVPFAAASAGAAADRPSTDRRPVTRSAPTSPPARAAGSPAAPVSPRRLPATPPVVPVRTAIGPPSAGSPPAEPAVAVVAEPGAAAVPPAPQKPLDTVDTAAEPVLAAVTTSVQQVADPVASAVESVVETVVAPPPVAAGPVEPAAQPVVDAIGAPVAPGAETAVPAPLPTVR